MKSGFNSKETRVERLTTGLTSSLTPHKDDFVHKILNGTTGVNFVFNLLYK